MDTGQIHDLRKVIDYMIEEKDFVTIFGELLRLSHKFPLNNGVPLEELLDIFVEKKDRWNGHLQHLLDILRVAVIARHTTAVQTVCDQLDNDDVSVYQELARGLAIADDDMVQLLLEASVSVGLSKERLINHAELLGKLDRITLIH